MSNRERTLVLTERQMTILQAVVEEYVDTATPVSSGSVCERAGLITSTATVRNEMALLEEWGLLHQPHTSAGRIPTDLGYRYYVDHLMTLYHRRRHAYAPVPPVKDPGVTAICRLLGELTRYTTLALVTGWQEQRLQRIEMASVGADQLLVLIITDGRQVMHSLTTVRERPGPPALRRLNDLLNNVFVGAPLSALTEEAISDAVAQLPSVPVNFTRRAPGLVRLGLEQDAPSRIHVEGAAHIFDQQDFSDMPKLRALMEALSQETAFQELFARTRPGEIGVSIGEENPHPGLDDCAIVFTSYRINDHATGQVGVLGPRRMSYRHVIRTLDGVVHRLNKRLSEDTGTE